MVTIAATLHHEDNDAKGCVEASTTVSSPKTSDFICEMLAWLPYLVKLHLVTIVFAARQPREVYRWRLGGHVLFRDRDRNSDVLDLADRRLEQDAKNEKSCAIP